jgi:hypothetical protein
LHCEKEPEAIKECIRKNERLAITLYRDGLSATTAAPQDLENGARVLKLDMAPPLGRLSA